MSVSFERAFLLLSVVEKAAAHASQYSALIGAAGIELSEMNKNAQKDIDEHAKHVAAAAAKAKAEEDAKREKLAAEEEAKAKAEARASIPNPTHSPEPSVRRPITETPNVS